MSARRSPLTAAHLSLRRSASNGRVRATIALIAGGILIAGCQSAPISGRKQFVMIPESQEIALGRTAYAQALAGQPLCQDEQVVAMVNRVGERIAAAANKPEYDWEFKVIAKDEQNAFALPGGKVAIYEGILPICQDEAGLAVVMSHEIAHALARHGGERMSQQAAVSGIGGVFNGVVQQEADQATAEKLIQVYGAATHYGVLLPYSRKHESEADAIGLILMAKAGYDPSAAPEFWARFAQQSSSTTPELLSTHPSDARRAADLRTMLPQAMNYYQAAPIQLGLGEPLPAVRRQIQSLTQSAPATPAPELSQLAFAPGAPQKATRDLPPPKFKRDESPTDNEIMASADHYDARRETYRLPVGPNGQIPATTDPYSLSEHWGQPLDDGWRPASSRSFIQ